MQKRNPASKVDDFKQRVRNTAKSVPGSIHEYSFDIYDDKDGDSAVNALTILSGSSLSVTVVGTIKFYNKSVTEVERYFVEKEWTGRRESIRYYSDQYEDGRWCTIVEVDAEYFY